MAVVLERAEELAATGDLVEHVLDGRGGLVLIEGDAGIGKTTLVDAARDLARRRGLAAPGARGAELERELAFGVVRELLASSVSPEAAPASAAAVLSPGAPSRPGVDLFGVLQGLSSSVADRTARDPLLLTVDDVPGRGC
ncbi:MAG: transcriptional regulator, LuxR family [Actinomycetospora sp.]|nr:transcriptional regulator, LuxR family [Actinomycetospora sp.]